MAELEGVVKRVLDDFVGATVSAFGDDLRSIVLYGSAAEGQLRATSDVNVVIVLGRFAQKAADAMREPLRVAHAAVRLSAMFLLESETTRAAEAFAVKFDDILHRHTVLFGSDPFSSLVIPRSATIARLKQILLNLKLRLREAYVLRGLREEQLSLAVADAAGPLRASAHALLELEGRPAPSPKQALETVVGELADPAFFDVLAHLSQARETKLLPPGVAGSTLFRLIDLCTRLRERADRLVLEQP